MCGFFIIGQLRDHWVARAKRLLVQLRAMAKLLYTALEWLVE